MGIELDSLPSFIADSHYETTGSIADATDVDFYSIKSPQVAGNPLNVMTVAVRSLDVAGLIPKLTVLDEDQNPLATEVVVNGGGELVVQVPGIVPQSDYVDRAWQADGPGRPIRLGKLPPHGCIHQYSRRTGSDGDRHGRRRRHLECTYNLYWTTAALSPGLGSGRRPPRRCRRRSLPPSGTKIRPSSPRSPLRPVRRRSLPGVFLNAGTYTVEVVVRTLDGSQSAGHELQFARDVDFRPVCGRSARSEFTSVRLHGSRTSRLFLLSRRFHIARSVLVGQFRRVAVRIHCRRSNWGRWLTWSWGIGGRGSGTKQASTALHSPRTMVLK